MNPSQKLRVIVEPETDEDLAAGLPTPSFAVRDKVHLLELLREGLEDPFRDFTDESIDEIRREVHRRHAAQQQP